MTMLSPEHPLAPITARLRIYLADAADTAEQLEYRNLLVRLESGLFERLPQVVISAVCQYGARLHNSLDAILVEIARYIACDEAVPSALIASFRLRLEIYHDIGFPTGYCDTRNVLAFDPPR